MTNQNDNPTNEAAEEQAESGKTMPYSFSPSRGLVSWMASQKLSLAFSTYKIGKVFWVGTRDGRLSVMQRDFNRSMGLDFDKVSHKMAIATQWQVWTMGDLLREQEHPDYDRLFAPRVAYVTGDVDAHDVGFGSQGIYFVNTKFSCIAKVEEDRNFSVYWQPPFISRIVAEDRCHLNGLALVDGRPAFATACSQTDVYEGWRDNKTDGGVLIDILQNKVICEGLSMPHSPRVHNGKVWLLNSGQGELGYVENGKFVPVTFLPGFARGLRFFGDYAFVGLSKSRDERAFSHLPLSERLDAAKVKDRCGIFVVHLGRGEIVERLEFDGILNELYDVAVMPGVRNPSAIGIRGNEAHYMIRFES